MRRALGTAGIVGFSTLLAIACEEPSRPSEPAPPAQPVAGSQPSAASTATSTPPPAEPKAPTLEPFTETIQGTDVSFEMLAIPAGTFTMGSPDDEPGRQDDEGPQREVTVGPFWMAKYEVTWDLYALWAEKHDTLLSDDAELAKRVDGASRPTPPYTDMTFGMGREGYPAICMTQHAAKGFCAWLSVATGHTYRLPTEAEWEYACRAGTTTAYSFGDDPAELRRHGWSVDNSRDQYRKVGEKNPNPWGLHDMHGNVAEWVLDQYVAEGYAPGDAVTNPLVEPEKEYPRVVRGGSWQDPPEMLRSAARRGSDPSWKEQDPQIPKSIWYHTDAIFLGFRVVRVPN